MFKHFMLIASILVTLGCSQLTDKNIPQSLAPPSLAEKTLLLDVIDTSSTIIPDNQLTKSGTLISYFKDQTFLADLTEMGGPSVTGTYSYQSNNVNNATLTQKMPIFYSTEKRELRISTELTFLQKNGGDFVSEVYDNNDLSFKHTGHFSLSNKPITIMPEGVDNKKLKIDIQSIQTTLPVAPFAKDDKFEIAFHANEEPALDLAGNFRYVSNDFSVNKIDPLTRTITGTFAQHNLPYAITLTFGSLRDGTFTLDLDKGQTKATGYFYMLSYTPSLYAKLKGTLTDSSFNSNITHINYPYSVYLPPGYDTTGKNYPIVYVTDGQWQKNFASLLDYRNKEVIMVAIDQGPGNDRRAVDFKMPGATAYMKFLKEEFAPMIEAKYRTNRQRSYFGHSFGGLLGVTLISQEQGDKLFFKNYILSDSSIWAITPEVIATEETNYKRNSTLPIKILLSSGKGDRMMKDYVARLLNRHYQGISIIYKEYNLLHEEIAPPTFIDFMDQID